MRYAKQLSHEVGFQKGVRREFEGMAMRNGQQIMFVVTSQPKHGQDTARAEAVWLPNCRIGGGRNVESRRPAPVGVGGRWVCEGLLFRYQDPGTLISLSGSGILRCGTTSHEGQMGGRDGTVILQLRQCTVFPYLSRCRCSRERVG